MKVSVERDASMDVSYDSLEERVKPISVDPLSSKETKASLSGMEQEFEFPFVDCYLSEEKDPQLESMDVYQEVAIRSEMAFLLSRTSRSLLTSGGSKASSTRQQDKPKFLHDHQ
ncbi:hypothetical protein AMTRI_Chr09g38080 [Amborella trichopoda]